MTPGDFTNRFAYGLIHAALAKGYDFKTICRVSGIAPRIFPGAEFTSQELAKLSRHVKLLMQDEFCGLTSNRCKIGSFEMMCDIVTSAATLRRALDKGMRLYALLSADIVFSLTEHSSLAALQVDLSNPELDRQHFLTEWWLLVWWAIGSWLIGDNLRCHAFEFPHDPGIREMEYHRVYAGPCGFGKPAARMVFARHYLDRPVVRTLGNLQELFLIPRLDFGVVPGVTHNLRIRLASYLRAEFQEKKTFPCMETVAGHFNLSSQTLRRRLDEEGSSYRAVKDEVRRELVLRLLQDPFTTTTEVARQCGFSEASALARAVKTWTGVYPKQYRQQLAQGKKPASE